jgi:DNA-binding Xre family transcriptional regulator
MKRRDLLTAAKISSSSVAKLTKGENVSTDVLVKICKALNCDVSEIMEILPDE